jgi:hypothetical protein
MPPTRQFRIRRTGRFVGLTILCFGFMLLGSQAPSANQASNPGGPTFWGLLIGGGLMIVGGLIAKLYWNPRPGRGPRS